MGSLLEMAAAAAAAEREEEEAERHGEEQAGLGPGGFTALLEDAAVAGADVVHGDLAGAQVHPAGPLPGGSSVPLQQGPGEPASQLPQDQQLLVVGALQAMLPTANDGQALGGEG